MRLSHRRGSAKSAPIELSMVSMIDVVFLLLIFFLVTTSFVRPELRLASMINSTEAAAVSSSVDLEPATVDIVKIGDHFVYRIGQVESDKLDAVEQVLLAFSNKENGAIVRATDAAPFDLPARAIDLCHTLGFRPIHYTPLK